MIPLFRKIRKQFADDNKPLKYARYAIGEIVLVVIGILIALQVNNWNEERKLNKLEIATLNEIKISLEQSTLDLETSLKITVSWYKAFAEKQDMIKFTLSQIEDYIVKRKS